MKYVVQMGSDAMIHISSFIKTGSGIQKLKEGIHRHTNMEIAYGITGSQIRAICILFQYLALETLQKRVGLPSQSVAMHYHTEAEQLSEEVWNTFV
jgi:hypothetical protein